ncbi:MAG: histidine phosphatase family protein [Fuerstiella sp.]|nr:histidine phosphatase family protein [Fuerstiella sp.]MCP4854893.1 histidine phosphatase family protein [Fuerstiella sp.]
MSTVVLIRPGLTDYDEQSRILGTLEMPMNDKGLEQVEGIVRRLRREGVQLEAIFASPFDPCCSTARAIAEAQKGVKIKELEELRNVDQGLWQGLPEADVRKRYPKIFRTGREKPQTICPPEGETLSEACQRMQKVFTRAIRKYQVFAVVASDPIATVIRCTLEARCPSVGACLCGEHGRASVEFFETDSFDSSRFLDSVQSTGSAELSVESAPSETTT